MCTKVLGEKKVFKFDLLVQSILEHKKSHISYMALSLLLFKTFYYRRKRTRIIRENDTIFFFYNGEKKYVPVFQTLKMPG